MVNNSLWREVSINEREQIKQDSKQLLNEFALKLSKIKAPEGHFENGTGMREDGDCWDTDDEFRNIMFLNAPFVEDGSIVAEKGSWKK